MHILSPRNCFWESVLKHNHTRTQNVYMPVFNTALLIARKDWKPLKCLSVREEWKTFYSIPWNLQRRKKKWEKEGREGRREGFIYGRIYYFLKSLNLLHYWSITFATYKCLKYNHKNANFLESTRYFQWTLSSMYNIK